MKPTKTVLVPVSVTDDTKFIHVQATTDKNLVNHASPPEKMTRQTFVMVDGKPKPKGKS